MNLFDDLPFLREKITVLKVSGLVCELVMWTEQNDSEGDYGSFEFSLVGELEEERKLNPSKVLPDVWPDWAQGVPKLVRQTGWTEGFIKDRVTYRSRLCTVTTEFDWCSPRNLSALALKYSRLPSNAGWEWSGVYRVFVDSHSINRLLASDPTGTLYIGMAGNGDSRWSIMRTRLMDLANRRKHQLPNRWFFNEKLKQRFPWNSLLVEWAFIQDRRNDRGDKISGAPTAEKTLLRCYESAFGELPPFNEKV